MLFEHVFHHAEFDPTALGRARRAERLTVSVCLPARNEATTIGTIVERIITDHVHGSGLVDEIVVVDDGSTDDTAAVAAAAGARVERSSDILVGEPAGSGKGDVLWKSLHVTTGDIVCWLDADLSEFESHFVTGLIGPLLTRPGVGFVKAFYDRPLDDEGMGGGRVTELVARPLISLLFPHLAPVVQPLGGEYAGRRSLLEQVPFVQGWGVEFGLLVDIVEEFGSRTLAQVDLGVRRHRHRPLDELGPQAMAILSTALRKAGVDDQDGWGRELLRVVGAHGLERIPVEIRERPPIATVGAYIDARRASGEARERSA